MLFTFFYVQIHEVPLLIHISDIFKQNHFQQNDYIKPWARAPPYLFGLFVGMLYMEYLDEIKRKKSLETSKLNIEGT